MLLITNNIESYMDLPSRAIVRINMAWENSPKKVEKAIKGTLNQVYLDFPMGRTKHPLPRFTLDQAIEIANKYAGKIKLFAISNVESPELMAIVREKLDKQINIVPKIETETGVKNVVRICKSAKTKVVMLDREDLTSSLKYNMKKVLAAVDSLYAQANKNKIQVLGLQGVVFADKKLGDSSSITSYK